ncbi:MAG: LysR substrate-binding domain-containing protein [Myxococcaceae bacterium]
MPGAPVQLDDAALFVDAVRAGGVRALARQRAVPRSTVSRALTRLEAALGLKLVLRHTTRLTLTEPGERCFDRLAAAVDEAREALLETGAARREVTGLLRISTTPNFADQLLPELVARFLARHPRASVEVVPASQKVDLEVDRIDVALRAGALADSEHLTARRLGAFTLGFYASPAYVSARGSPSSVAELLGHDLLATHRANAAWLVNVNGKTQTVRVSARAHAESTEFLRQLCLRGVGIARLPTWQAEADVRARKLVPVLEPAWLTADLHLVHALKTPARARAFAAVCSELLAKASLAEALRATSKG